MAKDRRTKDQKRKVKLAKRAKEARKIESLAYTGEKFKTDELMPFLMETEVAIYQAYVLMEGRVVDQQVAHALESLVKQMRHGTLKIPSVEEWLVYVAGQEEAFTVQTILSHWANFFQYEWKPSREQCIGVARTIRGSLETHRSAGAQSQGYLRFISDVLAQNVKITMEEVEVDQGTEV